jgi:hypothetical protein
MGDVRSFIIGQTDNSFSLFFFFFLILFLKIYLQLFDLRLLINKLAAEALRVRELDIVFNGD